MKVVVQRVSNASVNISGVCKGKIGKGFVLLVSFTNGDSSSNIDWMVNKISNLRIFDDPSGVMNLSIKDVSGSILSISQFTLYGNCQKGNRPSYINALGGDSASLLYNEFNNKLRNNGIIVEEGIFGSDMKVSLINDGPVTIILEK